jgi:hypothetical protein
VIHAFDKAIDHVIADCRPLCQSGVNHSGAKRKTGAKSPILGAHNVAAGIRNIANLIAQRIYLEGELAAGLEAGATTGCVATQLPNWAYVLVIERPPALGHTLGKRNGAPLSTIH